MYMILRPFLSIYPVLDRVILMHLLDTDWVAYNLFIIIVEAWNLIFGFLRTTSKGVVGSPEI